ncbi:MAG TPA: DMT family transporter [Candidatus Margulisiibacteriota bacterium]|nr:DMT family transporter [Candidatus Margulisiibacteriota bacterium]
MDAAPAVTPVASRVDAELLAYAGLTAASLGWASAYVAGKLALAEMTPLTVAAWRFVVAALILVPFGVRGAPWREVRRVAGALSVLVACGSVLYPWLFLLALSRTTATNTALLIALNPVFTILLTPLIGERLSAQRLTGVALALLGAATVITKGEVRHLIDLSFNSGDLLAVAAAAIWSVFNLASRRVVLHVSPAFTNSVVYVVGGVALCLLALPEHPWVQVRAASAAAIGGVVIMAVGASVFSGQFFLMGVRTLGVSRAVVFIYLMPVLTAVLSAALLGERFGPAQLLGGAAVLAGVYWGTRARSV